MARAMFARVVHGTLMVVLVSLFLLGGAVGGCAAILGLEAGRATDAAGGAGGAGGSGASGGAGEGGADELDCGSLTTVQDDFEDAPLHRRWIEEAVFPGQVEHATTPGEGSVTLTSGANGRAALYTSAGYHLENARLFAEIEVKSLSSGRFDFEVRSFDGARFAGWRLEAGTLTARSDDAMGMQSHGSAILTSAEGPLGLAIAATDTEIVFLTSHDSESFVVVGSRSLDLFPSDYVRARFVVEGDGAAVTLSSVNADYPPAQNPGWCGPDAIPASFEAGWDDGDGVLDPDCTVGRGEHLTLTAGPDKVCVVRSTAAFDLQGKEVIVSVDDVAFTNMSSAVLLALAYDASNRIGVVHTGSAFRIQTTTMGETIATETIDHSLFEGAHFRLGIANTTLFVSTSEDGTTWSPPEGVDMPGAATDLRIELGVFGPPVGEISARFDIVEP